MFVCHGLVCLVYKFHSLKRERTLPALDFIFTSRSPRQEKRLLVDLKGVSYTKVTFP